MQVSPRLMKAKLFMLAFAAGACAFAPVAGAVAKGGIAVRSFIQSPVSALETMEVLESFGPGAMTAGTGSSALLVIRSLGGPATRTVVAGERNVSLLQFETRAAVEDTLLTGLTFVAAEGDVRNAENYSLWVDTGGEPGVVDTIIQGGVAPVDGKVTFDRIVGGGGYLLAAGQTVRMEIHADISRTRVSDTLRLAFDTASPTYVRAETVERRRPLVGIVTDGVGTGEISVLTRPATLFTLRTSGDLFVTQDPVAIREHMLLGGTLSDPVLRLNFRAEDEDIEVRVIRLGVVGTGRDISVDRFELFREGATAPFATASVGATGSASVPSEFMGQPMTTYSAVTSSRQLIVAEGTAQRVIVKARMRTDRAGGESGRSVKLVLHPDPIISAATGRGFVQARGDFSSNDLNGNDEDDIAEGEVFLGTDVPGPNRAIVGRENDVVMSRIASITNVSPDPDGSSILAGAPTSVGEFRFTALPNNNDLNGLNKVVLSDLIFNVAARNVQMSLNDFKFYNKANQSEAAGTYQRCHVPNDQPLSPTLMSDGITGFFIVVCPNFRDAALLDTAIDSGSFEDFVLKGVVIDSSISSTLPSFLQVSLAHFNNRLLRDGLSSTASHIRWVDQDAATSEVFQWVEHDADVVRSTEYRL